jgi:hypothetical protein
LGANMVPPDLLTQGFGDCGFWCGWWFCHVYLVFNWLLTFIYVWTSFIYFQRMIVFCNMEIYLQLHQSCYNWVWIISLIIQLNWCRPSLYICCIFNNILC